MKDILSLALKLFIISVVAAALLGVTYEATKGPIEQGNIARAIESRQAVLSEADDFEAIDVMAVDGVTYNEMTHVTVEEAFFGRNDGEKSGMTVKVTTKGYNPGIEMTVGFTPDGNVEAISIGSHTETPGLGANASEPKFKDQFIGKKPHLSVGSDIDSITSATKTSVGVVNGVNTAHDFFVSVYESGGIN